MKKQKLNIIIDKYQLIPNKTLRYVEDCLKNGEVSKYGKGIADILPKTDPYSDTRTKLRNEVFYSLNE
jgi:hypothetical protein